MPLEVGLWRVDGPAPVKVLPSGVPLEAQLEHMIEADPTILGTRLLLIGRQVPTDYGKFIDLLAVDEEGALHILELKRDRTPREVVAQLLDYGSWVQNLGDQQVRSLYATYKPGRAIEQGWSDTFGDNPPDELNAAHRLTVVASDIDPATERIIEYLAGLNVPINVVFFRYFKDDGRAYLARTFLIDETSASGKGSSKAKVGAREPWNEQDWYVSFGEETGGRSWEDARRYGFVSAGGSTWFSKTIRKLPVGARVFTCIPKVGYVGAGTVTGEGQPFNTATVTFAGSPSLLSAQQLQGNYEHPQLPDEDWAEYVVPVTWLETRPRDQALWARGCSPTRTRPASSATPSRSSSSPGHSSWTSSRKHPSPEPPAVEALPGCAARLSRRRTGPPSGRVRRTPTLRPLRAMLHQHRSTCHDTRRAHMVLRCQPGRLFHSWTRPARVCGTRGLVPGATRSW